MDGVGGCLGYAEILNHQGIPAEAVFHGTPQLEVQWLSKQFDITLNISKEPHKKYDSVSLIDVCDPEILDPSIEIDSVVEIIDHHLVNKAELFKNAKIQLEKIGAAATQVVERFIQLNLKPTPKTAIALYAGLASNTANLKNRETTDRDLAAQKFLIEECGVDPSFIHDMFIAKSNLSGIKLIDFLEDDYVSRKFGSLVSCPLQLEIVDVKSFVESHQTEMKEAFDHFKKKYQIDILFYNLVDLIEGYNLIVSYDHFSIKFLEKVFKTTFENGEKTFSPIYMRKEIQYMIRDHILLQPSV
jgi:inorganic pyrophosphatase/exopolyphosphatase